MNKIIIEDNIPLSNNDSSSNYKQSCFLAMSKLKVGQSILIHDRSEGTVKVWIRKMKYHCSENSLERIEKWRNDMIGGTEEEIDKIAEEKIRKMINGDLTLDEHDRMLDMLDTIKVSLSSGKNYKRENRIWVQKTYNKIKKEIEMLSVYGKDLSFKYSVLKSEKPIIRYVNSCKKEVKLHPIRVWRIK